MLGKLTLSLIGIAGLAMLAVSPGVQPARPAAVVGTGEPATPVVSNQSDDSKPGVSNWVDSISVGPLGLSTSKLGPGAALILLTITTLWPLLKELTSKSDKQPISIETNNQQNPSAESNLLLTSDTTNSADVQLANAHETNSNQTVQNNFHLGAVTATNGSESHASPEYILEVFGKGYELGAEVSLTTVLVDSINRSKADLKSLANEFKEEAHAEVFKLGKREQLLNACENIRDETDLFWFKQATVMYGDNFENFIDTMKRGSEQMESQLRKLREMIREYRSGADVTGVIEQKFKELYREISRDLTDFENKLDTIELDCRNKTGSEYVLQQTKKAFGEITQIEGKTI